MKVEAYKTKDGTLFENETDQKLYDLRYDLKVMSKTLANTIMNRAPHVDDWQCQAISDVDTLDDIIQKALNDYTDVFRQMANTVDEIRTIYRN